jgi:hypothetical protein
LRIFTETVAAWYRKRAAKQCGTANSECGGLTDIQRASSDLRLNPHFHTLFLDGVYVRDDADENAPPMFHAAPPPSQDDVQAVVQQAAKRIVRFLQKRGLIALAIAPKAKGRLCAEQWGFNLHAATHVHGNDKQGREHLCRYILRPPFANHRLQTLPDGKVQLDFKRPWSDGTNAVVLAPHAFIARLAAIIPHPGATSPVTSACCLRTALCVPALSPPPRTPPLLERTSAPHFQRPTQVRKLQRRPPPYRAYQNANHHQEDSGRHGLATFATRRCSACARSAVHEL